VKGSGGFIPALKREAFSSILRKEATAEDGTHFDELFEVI